MRSTSAQGKAHLGRRPLLLGLASTAACAGSTSGWDAQGVVGRRAQGHWSAPLLGTPGGMVLLRTAQFPPRIRGFFALGSPGDFCDVTRDAVAARSCAQREIYWGLGGSQVVALWGVDPRMDPATPGSTGCSSPWVYRGANAAGVRWFADSPTTSNWGTLLVFPGGTWVSARDDAAPRLAAAWGAGMTAPPPATLAEGALFVEQVDANEARRETYGGMEDEGVRALPTILGYEHIVGRTTATYATPPGADVPTLLAYDFDDPGRASDAATDLRRFPHPAIERPPEAFPHIYFAATLDDVRVEGAMVMLRGRLPYQNFASTAPLD